MNSICYDLLESSFQYFCNDIEDVEKLSLVCRAWAEAASDIRRSFVVLSLTRRGRIEDARSLYLKIQHIENKSRVEKRVPKIREGWKYRFISSLQRELIGMCPPMNIWIKFSIGLSLYAIYARNYVRLAGKSVKSECFAEEITSFSNRLLKIWAIGPLVLQGVARKIEQHKISFEDFMNIFPPLNRIEHRENL